MTAFQNPPGAQGSTYDRYRYLLRTASPAEIEAAHEQTFARMSPLERRQVRRALVAAHTRPANESPAALARAATQLNRLRPGALDRALGASSPGRTVLGSLVSGVVGSTVFAFVLYPYLGALGLEVAPACSQAVTVLTPALTWVVWTAWVVWAASRVARPVR